MLRRVVILAIGSILAGSSGSTPGSAAPPPSVSRTPSVKTVPVPGTSLHISLPDGWEIAPSLPGALVPTALHYKGNPGFEVTVKQNNSVPHAEFVMSLPFECDAMFGALQAALKFQLMQRPDFIPGEYYSRILVPPPPKQGEVISTCLYLGNSVLGLMIRPAPNSGDGQKLAPLLQAIADSGRQSSTLLYAPGSLKLPVMQVTASLTKGIWAVGPTSILGSSRKADMVIRVSGTSELKIVPQVFPGPCALFMNPGRRKAPPYVSSKWEPFAWESPAPHNQLQMTVCREITPAKMLLVMMEYGAPAVPAGEAAEISTALDEIANGISAGQH
jgi:hypothetical protein